MLKNFREEREGRLPPPPPIRERGAPTTGDDASHLHHQNPTQRSPPPANATTTDFWAVRHCPPTKIKSIRLPKRIGHHSGFAFVEFGTKQEANNAVQALSSTHLYGRHLVLERAKERESLEDLRARTASQISDRQDGMSSILPLFICLGQWREPSVVNDYMGSLDGGAYQEKYSGNSRAGMRSTTKFYGNDECNG